MNNAHLKLHETEKIKVAWNGSCDSPFFPIVVKPIGAHCRAKLSLIWIELDELDLIQLHSYGRNGWSLVMFKDRDRVTRVIIWKPRPPGGKTIQQSPLTLYSVRLPLCHFWLKTKNRTMSKSCYVTMCTANKPKNPELSFYKLSTTTKRMFKDTKVDTGSETEHNGSYYYKKCIGGEHIRWQVK